MPTKSKPGEQPDVESPQAGPAPEAGNAGTARKGSGRRKKRRRARSAGRGAGGKRQRVERPYPREPLEEALKIPYALKEKNGGNPWTPDAIARAAYGISHKTNKFYYLSAAARDFGLTDGTRDSKEISLAEFGRTLVYAETPAQEAELRRRAFLKVELFRNVLEYYKGSDLPEMQYLSNTLTNRFNLAPETHEEFSGLFRQNCNFLGIGQGFGAGDAKRNGATVTAATAEPADRGDVVTYAEPDDANAPLCFVIMPFNEKIPARPKGFFSEVLKHVIAPAGKQAGFRVVTATRKGSDLIHSTILRNLMTADLVIADLSDHNPNVLFELGVRMAQKKPVQLIRAEGTPAIFDVDHVLRVYDYSPNLWRSTVEQDVPRLADHLKATWANRTVGDTYMSILLGPGAPSDGKVGAK